MNIMVASNEKYIKYASVLFRSIIENNQNQEICFWVIYSGESCGEKTILKEEMKEIGYELNYIVPNKDLFSHSPRISENFVLATYYTLFPHLFLPNNLDRILYLDIDMVVVSNLNELYNLDFENNYLVAANQVPGFFGAHSYKEDKKKRGAYFNSGMILYNLRKMRQDIKVDFYDYCLCHSDEFFFDQGMLNWLFCEKTKYVETLEYNWRYDVARRNRNIKGKPCIIHFVCYGMPFKPWDLCFDEDELERLISANLVYNKKSFYIDKEINANLCNWWFYAKKSAFYDKLYYEMKVKKEYLIRTGVIQRLNNNLKNEMKYDEYKWFAVNKMKNIHNRLIESHEYNRLTDIDKFIQFRRNADMSRYMIFMSVKDDTSKYWSEFLEKIDYSLEKLAYREGLIAVLDGDVIYQSKGAKLLEKSFKIINCKNALMDVDATIVENYVTILSDGYNDDDGTSISSIMINNFEYSLNQRGVNVVIFDRMLNGVVDSFTVNTYSNNKMNFVTV